MISLYYGFYDYWELRHKVTFDGVNKLIWINEGVTELDMQIDVYSDWKEWVRIYDNTKYFAALNTVGGEPTVGVERLDVTYFLINGWKFKPFPGSYDLVITGNVFDVDGGSIKVPADIIGNEPNNISISTNVSVIVRLLETNTGGSTGSFDPDTIVSASLFGIQEISLYNIENRVIAIESILQSPVTASLVSDQSASLYNVEQNTYSSSIDIVNLLGMNFSQSLQLSTLQTLNLSQSLQLYDQSILINSQSLQLNNMDTQLDNIENIVNTSLTGSTATDAYIREIWELHGLDISKPLLVTQTKRTFGTVDQDIVTVGTGSAQQTTITRN